MTEAAHGGDITPADAVAVRGLVAEHVRLTYAAAEESRACRAKYLAGDEDWSFADCSRAENVAMHNREIRMFVEEAACCEAFLAETAGAAS